MAYLTTKCLLFHMFYVMNLQKRFKCTEIKRGFQSTGSVAFPTCVACMAWVAGLFLKLIAFPRQVLGSFLRAGLA